MLTFSFRKHYFVSKNDSAFSVRNCLQMFNFVNDRLGNHLMPKDPFTVLEYGNLWWSDGGDSVASWNKDKHHRVKWPSPIITHHH